MKNPEMREVLLRDHGNSPDVSQVPDHGFQEGLRMVTGDVDRHVDRLNCGPDGWHFGLQPGGRAKAKGIDHNDEDESPDEPGGRATAVALGLGFPTARRVMVVVHVGSLSKLNLGGQRNVE